jgi:site-specific DNA recombinase
MVTMASSGVLAGIYVRISDDREGEGLGVERQEEDCRALAKQLKWRVREHVYSDNDISASRFGKKRRPGYDQLVADIEAGVVQAVLAYHPSRLHRRPLELEGYIDTAERVPTHTVRAGRWDLSTPAGRVQARIMAAVDAYESENKSDAIKRARLQRAQKGHGRPGGPRPYGFEKDGVTVRPTEAVEIVRLIEAVVEWTAPMTTGQSLRHLVRDLNERDVPTASGTAQWTSATLRDILMRPRNAGLVQYVMTVEDDDGNVVTKTEHAEAPWEPLVPRQTWQAVCAILSDESRRTNHRGGMVRWLGSGLYVCGVCERPTLRVGTGAAGKGGAYRCRNRDVRNGGGHVTREAGALDRYVEALLVKRISDPRVLKKLREMPAATPDARKLTVELSALGIREDTLGRDYATGKVSERMKYSAMAEIAKRKEEIDAQLVRAGKRTPLDPFRKAKDAADVGMIWYGPDGPDVPASDRQGGLSLGARRALLDYLLTITVNPAPQARIRQPDGSHLDRASIGYEFKLPR